MRNVIYLSLGALLLAGCAGGADTTGTGSQRTTPANRPATGNATGTGQNNPGAAVPLPDHQLQVTLERMPAAA